MSNEVLLEKFVRMGSGRTSTRPSWHPCRAAVASPTSTLIRLLDFADLTAKLHPSQERLGLMGPVLQVLPGDPFWGGRTGPRQTPNWSYSFCNLFTHRTSGEESHLAGNDIKGNSFSKLRGILLLAAKLHCFPCSRAARSAC